MAGNALNGGADGGGLVNLACGAAIGAQEIEITGRAMALGARGRNLDRVGSIPMLERLRGFVIVR